MPGRRCGRQRTAVHWRTPADRPSDPAPPSIRHAQRRPIARTFGRVVSSWVCRMPQRNHPFPRSDESLRSRLCCPNGLSDEKPAPNSRTPPPPPAHLGNSLPQQEVRISHNSQFELLLGNFIEFTRTSLSQVPEHTTDPSRHLHDLSYSTGGSVHSQHHLDNDHRDNDHRDISDQIDHRDHLDHRDHIDHMDHRDSRQMPTCGACAVHHESSSDASTGGHTNNVTLAHFLALGKADGQRLRVPRDVQIQEQDPETVRADGNGRRGGHPVRAQRLRHAFDSGADFRPCAVRLPLLRVVDRSRRHSQLPGPDRYRCQYEAEPVAFRPLRHHIGGFQPQPQRLVMGSILPLR
ncbi:unnamed protein product [Nesidiocoris tenuis]|uniref:Uncharacterized protein n=1 Tax=Nesidiocoris tenuis TaxID=355587 RepID=A0A6H5GKU0_9HEMI|nr:unnamed protein product [Nesidiocoris tenuis]